MYDATAVDYSSRSDDRVTDDRTIPHLGPFKEDAPLDVRPLTECTPFAYRSATADGGAGPYLTLLRYEDRRQQDNVFRDADGVVEARVLKPVAT